MADLIKLVSEHAYWSDKKRELKDKGSFELSSCEGFDTFEDNHVQIVGIGKSCIDTFEDNHVQIVGIGKSCIDSVVDILNQSRSEDPYYDCSFEEIWEEQDCEGHVCQHCRNVRELKKQRVAASRKLGGIRAAMTRVGRKLNEIKGNQNG